MVQEAMDNRDKDDARDHDDRQAAVEGIQSGKQFPRTCLEWSQGAHAGKNHRGVGKRIQPGQRFTPVISRHTDRQGGEHEQQTKCSAGSETAEKS